MTTAARPSDGLALIRLVLVISSLSPVFVLWAIRGVNVMRDLYWIPLCLTLFLVPNLLLWLFVRRARVVGNKKTVNLHTPEDHRDSLLTYLFAMLLPLYDANLDGWRDMVALLTAFAFVCFIFWHMRLHYMNIFFAVLGYRIFTANAENGTTGTDQLARTPYVIITKRYHLGREIVVTGYRLGADVLLEPSE